MQLRIKWLVILVLLNLTISGTTAQNDEYYEISSTRYSDNLKAGMEFTWEISKFNVNLKIDTFDNEQATQPTLTTSDDSYTTTTTSAYTTTVYETETYTEEQNEDFPDIKAGTTMTVKIIQDLANFDFDFNDYNYDYDDYQSYYEEFFEYSYSEGDEEEMDGFMPVELLITPNTIEFENGTVINLFEFTVEQYQKNQEQYEEYGIDTTFEIKDGIAIQKERYNDSEDNFYNEIEFQTDVDTGILIYLYVESHDEDGDYEIEFKLKNSQGINIDTVIANDDPTLSVPISAIFVYTLILAPVVASRIRKRNS